MSLREPAGVGIAHQLHVNQGIDRDGGQRIAAGHRIDFRLAAQRLTSMGQSFLHARRKKQQPHAAMVADEKTGDDVGDAMIGEGLHREITTVGWLMVVVPFVLIVILERNKGQAEREDEIRSSLGLTASVSAPPGHRSSSVSGTVEQTCTCGRCSAEARGWQ